MATMLQIEVTISALAVDGAAILTEKDVAAMLNLSRDTIRAMQMSHDGPACQVVGGRIRYTLEAVHEFQTQRSADHKRLMESYRAGCAHDNTVPALVGFAFGIADCPGIARIGNGLFCHVGKARKGAL